MNLTPKRLELLRLLRERGSFCVAGIAHELAPRHFIGERRLQWSQQGAARWGGGYVRPLEQAGLVSVNRRVSSGVGMASITEAGLAALEVADAAKAPA